MTKITIDVKNKTIQTLIDEVRSGKFVLPSFQRQYVWDEDDVRSLIDSIVNNYPIGTVILWKPSNISKIDPFSKPLIDTNNSPSEVFYVIDGQQRLTSLLLLFNDWKITRGGEDIKCDVPISYHPTAKRFYKSSSRGINLSKLVRAFCLNDLKTLRELAETVPEEQLKEIEEKIGKILNYPVPIYVMETYNEDDSVFKDMAEAFMRVNKYGVRIGNLELMLSFLAGTISGKLKEQIRNFYDRMFTEFEIDLQPVIRFVFSSFGLKMTQISKVEQFKKNVEKISTYNEKTAEEILKKCEEAMNITLNLIEMNLGIDNSRLLPSQVPLIPIAVYFHNKGLSSLDDIDEKEAESILNWFILTSFNGYYSSQPDTKLDEDIEIVKQSTRFPWEGLLENMQRRRARVKISFEDVKRGLSINVLKRAGRSYLFLLYVILAKNHADDWNGTLLKKAKYTTLARHHIFPREFLEQNLSPEDPETKEVLINNLANVTFIHKDVNSEIEDKPPEDYLTDYISSAKKHFIPIDINLWKIEQYTTFLEYRIREIYCAGKNLFGEIFE